MAPNTNWPYFLAVYPYSLKSGPWSLSNTALDSHAVGEKEVASDLPTSRDDRGGTVMAPRKSRVGFNRPSRTPLGRCSRLAACPRGTPVGLVIAVSPIGEGRVQNILHLRPITLGVREAQGNAARRLGGV